MIRNCSIFIIFAILGIGWSDPNSNKEGANKLSSHDEEIVRQTKQWLLFNPSSESIREGLKIHFYFRIGAIGMDAGTLYKNMCSDKLLMDVTKKKDKFYRVILDNCSDGKEFARALNDPCSYYELYLKCLKREREKELQKKCNKIKTEFKGLKTGEIVS